MSGETYDGELHNKRAEDIQGDLEFLESEDGEVYLEKYCSREKRTYELATNTRNPCVETIAAVLRSMLWFLKSENDR